MQTCCLKPMFFLLHCLVLTISTVSVEKSFLTTFLTNIQKCRSRPWMDWNKTFKFPLLRYWPRKKIKICSIVTLFYHEKTMVFLYKIFLSEQTRVYYKFIVFNIMAISKVVRNECLTLRISLDVKRFRELCSAVEEWGRKPGSSISEISPKWK